MILEILGFKKVTIASPFDVKQVKVETPKTEREKDDPDRTAFYAGRKFALKNDDTLGEVYELSVGLVRSREVTSKDLDAIEAYNKTATRGKVKEDKYRELKPYWVDGLSAKEASKVINSPRKKRGYSESVLDNYWAVFNSLFTPGEGV